MIVLIAYLHFFNIYTEDSLAIDCSQKKKLFFNKFKLASNLRVNDYLCKTNHDLVCDKKLDISKLFLLKNNLLQFLQYI